MLGIFKDRVLQTICLGWFQTAILLMPASQEARITGMSHWGLALVVTIAHASPQITTLVLRTPY
jgi:hypothetical protein